MLRAVAATKNTYSLSTCVPVKAWHRTPVASRRLATRMRSEADEKKPTTGHDVPKTNVSSEANMDPEVVAFR